MSTSQLVAIAESIITLITLLVLLLKLWPEYRLDEFRQKMFSLRDEMFDFAASGKISFSHPSYILLRRSMNGFIRFAHELTFFRLCMILLRWKLGLERPNLNWTESLNASVKSISDQGVRSQLESFHSRAVTMVFRRLILGSPVLLMVVLVTTVFLFINWGWTNLKQAGKSAAERVMTAIVDPRMIEEEALKAAA